jgi:hypothetical protein
MNARRHGDKAPGTTAGQLQVAETILEQLGGRRFIAMTGRRTCSATPTP